MNHAAPKNVNDCSVGLFIAFALCITNGTSSRVILFATHAATTHYVFFFKNHGQLLHGRVWHGNLYRPFCIILFFTVDTFWYIWYILYIMIHDIFYQFWCLNLTFLYIWHIIYILIHLMHIFCMILKKKIVYLSTYLFILSFMLAFFHASFIHKLTRVLTSSASWLHRQHRSEVTRLHILFLYFQSINKWCRRNRHHP